MTLNGLKAMNLILSQAVGFVSHVLMVQVFFL